jgi:hypothetical protein
MHVHVRRQLGMGRRARRHSQSSGGEWVTGLHPADALIHRRLRTQSKPNEADIAPWCSARGAAELAGGGRASRPPPRSLQQRTAHERCRRCCVGCESSEAAPFLPKGAAGRPQGPISTAHRNAPLQLAAKTARLVSHACGQSRRRSEIAAAGQTACAWVAGGNAAHLGERGGQRASRAA